MCLHSHFVSSVKLNRREKERERETEREAKKWLNEEKKAKET